MPTKKKIEKKKKKPGVISRAIAKVTSKPKAEPNPLETLIDDLTQRIDALSRPEPGPGQTRHGERAAYGYVISQLRPLLPKKAK